MYHQFDNMQSKRDIPILRNFYLLVLGIDNLQYFINTQPSVIFFVLNYNMINARNVFLKIIVHYFLVKEDY